MNFRRAERGWAMPGDHQPACLAASRTPAWRPLGLPNTTQEVWPSSITDVRCPWCGTRRRSGRRLGDLSLAMAVCELAVLAGPPVGRVLLPRVLLALAGWGRPGLSSWHQPKRWPSLACGEVPPAGSCSPDSPAPNSVLGLAQLRRCQMRGCARPVLCPAVPCLVTHSLLLRTVGKVAVSVRRFGALVLSSDGPGRSARPGAARRSGLAPGCFQVARSRPACITKLPARGRPPNRSCW